MKNIAAIVDSLGPSQMSFYLIKRFNNLIKDVDYSPICFYNNLTKPVITPFFGCANIASLSAFRGAAISTNIETASLILRTCNKMDRYLYVWDLEWLRRPMEFGHTMPIFRHPKIQIIARSEDHKNIIENYINRDVCGIVEDWSIEDLMRII